METSARPAGYRQPARALGIGLLGHRREVVGGEDREPRRFRQALVPCLGGGQRLPDDDALERAQHRAIIRKRRPPWPPRQKGSNCRSPAARFSKRAYWERNATSILPVGPLRCLPTCTSAVLRASSSMGSLL